MEATRWAPLRLPRRLHLRRPDVALPVPHREVEPPAVRRGSRRVGNPAEDGAGSGPAAVARSRHGPDLVARPVEVVQVVQSTSVGTPGRRALVIRSISNLAPVPAVG